MALRKKKTMLVLIAVMLIILAVWIAGILRVESERPPAVRSALDLAFSPDGVLYAVSAASDQIFTVDVNTGAGSLVGSIGFPFVGGFDVLIYYAGLSNISESITEAAEIDGCTGVSKFFRIDIPMKQRVGKN